MAAPSSVAAVPAAPNAGESFHAFYYRSVILAKDLAQEQSTLTAAAAIAEDWARHAMVVMADGLAPELLAAEHILHELQQTAVSNAHSAAGNPEAASSTAFPAPSERASLPKVVLVLMPNVGRGSTAPADVASVLATGLAVANRLRPEAQRVEAIPDVLGVDDGAAPERRSAAYTAGGVVVLRARTAVTDLLCRRLATSAVVTAVVWGAEHATDCTGFVLAVLRDLDRSHRLALAARSSVPPRARSCLSIALRDAAVRGDVAEHLNPTSVRLVPRILSSLQQWLHACPSPKVFSDTVADDALSFRCEELLRTIIEELLSDLRRDKAAITPVMLTETFGRQGLEGGLGGNRRRQRGNAGNGDAGAVAGRRAYLDRKEDEEEREAQNRGLPELTYDALVTGQLDATVSTLSKQGAPGATCDIRAVAGSLQQLRFLAQQLPVASAPSFALLVDEALMSHRRRVLATRMGMRGVGHNPGHGLPHWANSPLYGDFIAATVARVFFVDHATGTLKWSGTIAGRLRFVRELLAGVVRRQDADSSTATEPRQSIVIAVENSAAMCDVMYSLLLPRLEDLEAHLFGSFVERYRQRFEKRPPTKDTGRTRATESDAQPEDADGAQIAMTSEALAKLEAIVAASQISVARRVGDDMQPTDSENEVGDEDGAGASPKGSAGPDDDVDYGSVMGSQLTACSTASAERASAHDMLLSYDITQSQRYRPYVPAMGKPTATPAATATSQVRGPDEVEVFTISSDDDGDDDKDHHPADIECVGDANSLSVPLAPDEVLFPSAHVLYGSESRIEMRVSPSLTVHVVSKAVLNLAWLIEHDPGNLILLDADRALLNTIEVFVALRPLVRRQACTQPPTVRLVRVSPAEAVRAHAGDRSASNVVGQRLVREALAEKAGLVRLNRLRESHVSEVTASGRARQLVENEVRWGGGGGGRRRGPLQEASRQQKQQQQQRVRGEAGRWQFTNAPAEPIQKGPDVILDVRELRASLPAMVFKAGLSVLPATLITADYVLSPDCGVERKAIIDLIGSLNSGRIASQIRRLEMRYRYPILLIEFNRGEPFSLARAASKTTHRRNASSPDVFAKLAKLALLHPRVIILWTRSPKHTADMFLRLKETIAAADPDASDPSLTEQADATRHEEVQAAVDMLCRLPGVHSGNVSGVMTVAGSLAGLSGVTRADLGTVMKPGDADMLHQFLSQPHRRHRPQPGASAPVVVD